MSIHTALMRDDSEIIHYDHGGVPLYVRTAHLSEYPKMRALCHWHEDLEFILVLEGEMNYYVNGISTRLKKNDCIMVNSRQLHYGYSRDHQDCAFACVLFHPRLLTGNPVLCQSYILPALCNPGPEYLYLSAEDGPNQEITSLLQRVLDLKEQSPFAYELETAGLLGILWSRLLRLFPGLLDPGQADISSDSSLQKEMAAYIYQHYPEKISLDDIAASGHVCRNKCCTVFRHYLQQSPIEFLNSYRLEVSRGLLTQTTDSVTQIALACGFNHLSYYSKLFFRSYGCSPSQYRSHLP